MAAETGGLLDGNRTSKEWSERKTDICVFPVGAFEQHSIHMPLAADNIEAEYFARHIACVFDAALLPTLNYATSLEHSGFAGTISLKPETLMQVVRDIAEEVESQGFKTMILVNGHGGNFALVPVVRDINRRNGKLKILKVDFWTFVDADTMESPALGKPDIHAGEFETSLMTALCPDLIGNERPDLKPAVDGFQQPDLTTFGVGYVSPEGTMGDASLASAEKGEAIVESIKRNMTDHIRRRLEWLENNRTYSGRR